MSNYAALLAPLAISGSRKSDGTANAGGKVYAYLPDTLTSTNIYADATAETIATQPITLDNGGRVPRANYPDGLFIVRPVRLLIQDSSGTTISDSVYVPGTAGATGVNNAGFTDSTLDGVLDKALTSFGGQDWLYKESGGATERTIKAKFSELLISVKDFGAVGDGVAIDTTAVQAAVNRVKALGGGVVYFPPGTFLIDQAITLTSANGVTFKGAGMGVTVITSSHATANVFTLTTTNNIVFEGFNVSNSGDSTGSVFSLTTANRVRFIDVGVTGITGTGKYRYGLNITTGSDVALYNCRFFGLASDAASRACLFTDVTRMLIVGGFQGVNSGSAYNVEFAGSSANFSSLGVEYSTSTAVRFALGLTGTGFSFHGGFGLTLSVATATIPGIRTYGVTDFQTSSTSSAVGAAQTPSLIGGTEVVLTAASGGAGVVTVNAPAVLPPTGSGAGDNLYWDFVFKNASGGAVTWTMNAIYILDGATAIPTTDGHTIMVRFRWDRATSELRECSRSDTVT